MLVKDLGYAVRSLRRNPVFSLTAVLTIALGIGASTAIFSVTNAVLLRPLPYKEPDRLVRVVSDMRKRNVKDFPFSNADFLDLRNATTPVFEELGAVFSGRNIAPAEDGTPEQIRFAVATPNFFRMMGGQIALGRDFSAEDGQPPAPPPPGGVAGAPAPQPVQITILSHSYWKRRFGGSASVLGKTLPGARGGGTLIVGVLAPDFELLFPPSVNQERLPDVWFAARVAYDEANRNNVALRAVARLKNGVTRQQADSAVEAVATDLRKKFAIKETSGWHIHVEPMHQHLVEEVRPAILALMGAVIFLLLIACSNVANLLLVRASLRERELAVRVALGGSKWRLISQTLAEALVLAATGALLGLGLAAAGIDELRAIAPPNLPRLDSIQIDPVVLGFTMLATLTAAVLFGMAPALRAARPDVAQVLRASGRTSNMGSAALRNAVVVVEVALSFVLLIGSGLMFRSFLALQHIDLGYQPRGLLTFQLLGGGGRQQPAQRAALLRDIQARLRALPGVESVTAANPFPLTGGYNPIRWGLEPALSDPTKFQAVDNQIVLPGYFETLRVPLLEGRTFTEADNVPERNLAIIDQLLAAKAFPKESAVGKRLLIRIRTPEPEWVEIIGVVAHHRGSSLAEPGREQIYFTDGFLSHGVVARWAVRTSGDPASLAGAVRAEIGKAGSMLLTHEMQPMDALVTKAQAGTRFSLLLIGVFAAVAALLAGVGLYGVLSTVVRQRTSEIGVRMALGANPGSIVRLVVGQGMRLSVAGIAGGLAAAFALTRLMATMLVGVKATDPVTFAAMAVVFLAIAMAASWLPASRAAGLDPTVALREE